MNENLIYFRNTLGPGVELEMVPSDKLDRLPLYLRGTHQFYKLKYLNNALVLVTTEEKQISRIKPLEIQLRNIEAKLGFRAALMLSGMSSSLKRKLVGHNINFVVPGKQLFLPSLMINLKDAQRTSAGIREVLLPSAQVILLSWILRRHTQIEEMTFKQMAGNLNYTAMAITNAVANMKSLKLCEVFGKREKYVHFLFNRKELWNQAIPFLINPIRRALYLDRLEGKCVMYESNLSALARYTNINEEADKHFAIAHTSFVGFFRDHFNTEIADRTEEDVHLELWKYDPGILVDPKIGTLAVDPLSLYLTLRDTGDERIEKALKQLLGGIEW